MLNRTCSSSIQHDIYYLHQCGIFVDTTQFGIVCYPSKCANANIAFQHSAQLYNLCELFIKK